MAQSSDHNSHGPGGDPDDQKVRVQPGSTGAKMAAEGPHHRHPHEGGAAPASDMTTTNNNNNNDNDNNSPPICTTAATAAAAATDDRRHLINRDDYSGLQVVEPGMDGPHSQLPEAVAPSGPQAQYAEYKAWGEHSPPPQAVLPSPHSNNLAAAAGAGGGGGGEGYPFPEAVSPGHTPISQPYSKTSSATYHGGHNPFEWEKQQQKQASAGGRICGLRRMVFWCVLAVAAFVVVAAVAVGVGVGLGTRDEGSSTDTTSTATGSHSVPSATATAVASPSSSSSIICPYANRTLYNLESSPGKNFLVLCGRDYNSCCGAVDMLTVNTTSFEDCLEHCGAQEGCTAVGWGNYYGVNTCWLKSAWGEPNWSGSWYAAVLVDDSGG